MKKLSELVKEVNRDNAPPDGWKKEDILKGSVICKAKNVITIYIKMRVAAYLDIVGSVAKIQQ